MQVHDPGFDEVYEAQQVFRRLLDAMAWPGSVGLLPPARVAPPQPWCPALVQVARTLFDSQVSFAVHGDGAELLARYLWVNTGARPSAVEAADYVVAGSPLDRLDVECLSPGTLPAPDRGATLILACTRVAEPPVAPEPDPGPFLLLTGRGVADRRPLGLGEADVVPLRRVAARRDAYPLGIDVILVDPAGHVAALPRTTRWEEVSAWAT